jgi:hypothetical protein
MWDPSGDQVGKPNVPFDASASNVDRPAASTIDSEPSALRTAIDPDDAMGVDGCDGAAEPLAAALAAGEGAAVALEAGFPDGAGPPHAATAISATQPRSATRLID